jgi:NAD kinase
MTRSLSLSKSASPSKSAARSNSFPSSSSTSSVARVVVVHRLTERQDIVRAAGTWGQAKFSAKLRGADQSLDRVQDRHDQTEQALQTVSAAIPSSWRRGAVERADLDRFLFEPDDVIVIVGPDGLVANTAKYLTGQPVIGINPDPASVAGVLVKHQAQACAALLAKVGEQRAAIESRTMVRAATDDGLELNALNEVYLGHPGHQSARYELITPTGETESQSSSGLLVGTGTGASGWLLSTARERHSPLPPLAPTDPALNWYVREAWPSPTTGATLTAGILPNGSELRIRIGADGLVAFGDGIEADHLPLTWGQTVTFRSSPRKLNLVLG